MSEHYDEDGFDDDGYTWIDDEDLQGEDGPITFLPDAVVIIETNSGIELGFLQDEKDEGIVFRSTHKMDPETLEMEERGRSVLTFLPWRNVERMELVEELVEDSTVRDFRGTMLEGMSAEDASDITGDTGSGDK